MKPDHKLSIFDAQNYLSNHYEGTEFDPLGHGEHAHKYRPISLAKTQESHILQMNRPGANIHWLAMGSLPKVPMCHSSTALLIRQPLQAWETAGPAQLCLLDF